MSFMEMFPNVPKFIESFTTYQMWWVTNWKSSPRINRKNNDAHTFKFFFFLFLFFILFNFF